MSLKNSSNFLTLSRLSGTGFQHNIASFKLSSGMYSSKYLFGQLAILLGNFHLNFSFSVIFHFHYAIPYRYLNRWQFRKTTMSVDDVADVWLSFSIMLVKKSVDEESETFRFLLFFFLFVTLLYGSCFLLAKESFSSFLCLS